VAVSASVDPDETGADAMIFKIELSQPAEHTIVLIYGTLDGSAKAGKDYEPQHGLPRLLPAPRAAKCVCL
jgi:hypothetical protein